MDEYIFKANIARCKYVEEATVCFEMFSYSNPSLNTIEEHPMIPEEFENFLQRRGMFAEPLLPEGVSLVAGVRLIVQPNAQHPDTFAPDVISLKVDQYISMIENLHLSYKSIERVLGPFFWWSWGQDHDNPHLQVIYRNTDFRKEGKAVGWELTLSHEIKTGVTIGFYKGTTSDIVECLKHLKVCIFEIRHPMLLPIIIYSNHLSYTTDSRHRDARDWLRRIEHSISVQVNSKDEGEFILEGAVDLDSLNRDLVQCQSVAQWKQPGTHIKILDSIEAATVTFFENLLEDEKRTINNCQSRLLSRIDFYRTKGRGIQAYSDKTVQRIEIQRAVLYNMIAQRESKLNLMMAGDQKRIAQASKRDSTAMKMISLLGTLFLPGAYLASIFSTTFFNFQNAPDMASTVSPRFWLYWAVTIPVTAFFVIVWYIWERKQEIKYLKEDAELDKEVDKMEKIICQG